jgi:hypothetical protein
MISNVNKNKSNIIININKPYINTITTNTIIFELSGYNPLYSPNSINESYMIRLYSLSHTYYSSIYNMPIISRLLALNSNLSMSRSSSIVSHKANYTLSGSVPYNSLINPRIIYNNTNIKYINNVVYFPFINLGEYINPMSIYNNMNESIKICN